MNVRAYRLLLRLYPRWFRDEYGAELERLWLERGDGWFRTVRDVVGNAVRTRLERQRPLPGQRERQRTAMFWRDVRDALRGMRRQPTFSVLALFTLCLGVGATMGVLVVAYGLLMRPLPYPESERLVAVYETRPELQRGRFSPADYEDFAAQTSSFAALGGYTYDGHLLTGQGEARALTSGRVTASFFDVLGRTTAVGRVFDAAEERAAANVAVLSYGTWQSLFGGARDAVGRTITLDGTAVEVIGVMPRGFDQPVNVALWRPLRPTEDPVRRRNFHFLRVVGRLQDGVTLEAAHADAARAMQQLVAAYPEANADGGIFVESLRDSLVGDVRPALRVMVGAVLCLLLIACANAAALFLVRGSTRRREMAVRVAMGAARARLARLVLIEGLVYGVAAGVLGLLVASLVLTGMTALAEGRMPLADAVVLDARLALLLLLGAAAIGVLCASPQLLSVLRTRATADLAGARGTAGDSAGRTARATFVTVQIALAVVLTITAGVLFRSLSEFYRADLGFEQDRLALFQPTMPGAYMEDSAGAAIRYTDAILAGVRSLPGVAAAGAAVTAPLSGGPWTTSWSVPGREPAAGAQEMQWNAISPGYVDALGIEIVRGRDIAQTDRLNTETIALLNETAARRIFGDDDPIGEQLQLGGDPAADPVRIVGVIRDVELNPVDRAEPSVYQALAQSPMRSLTVMVRTRSAVEPVLPLLRARAAEVDAAVTVPAAFTMRSQLDRFTAAPRFNAVLLSSFAGTALLLALIGVYGLLSYAVLLRRPEIGVRMAVGARPATIAGMVLRDALRVVVPGIVAGALGALAAARLIASLVFGISARDTSTYVLVLGAVAAVAIASALLPAARAARTDPLISMRT